MYETIIQNEFKGIWNQADELLTNAMKRKDSTEILKTDGLLRLDEFFNLHRQKIKIFMDENTKLTEQDKDLLEDFYEELITLVQNCLPEKGAYNKLQKIKYKEMIIIFLSCFIKAKIITFH